MAFFHERSELSLRKLHAKPEPEPEPELERDDDSVLEDDDDEERRSIGKSVFSASAVGEEGSLFGLLTPVVGERERNLVSLGSLGNIVK